MATPWPTDNRTVQFGPRSFHLLAQRDNHYPAVAVRLGSDDRFETAETPINRFLSALSWASEGKMAVFQHGGSSRYPQPLVGFDRNRQFFQPYFKGCFPFAALPEFQEDQMFALALWREGMTLEWISSVYAFLSFFKIVERAFRNRHLQEQFFARELPTVQSAGHRISAAACDEICRLETRGTNVVSYLLDRARNSLAHANVHRRASDPDEARESARLARSLPIMKSLAYLCMTEELRIPRPSQL
jgi:hypothetical protein